MTQALSNKPFPIQGDFYRDESGAMRYNPISYIPWWLAEEAYSWYKENFGPNCQTLERLAERGGFGRQELLMLLRRVEV